MSEEEKINQPTNDNQPPAENENIAEPLTIINEPSTIMEVHKHPHHVTHKKKWGEYLLEFFMLFFAVFLGFVAENIREASVERHREKEYMQSLVNDLKADTANAETVIKDFLQRQPGIDSIIENFDDMLQGNSGVFAQYRGLGIVISGF